MSHVSVPSTFRILSVRFVHVHTVRRVQPPSTTAYARRPAIIPIKYAAHCHGMHFPLFFNLLTPNDPYMSRTAPLTSKRCILYIYSTNTEWPKKMYTLFTHQYLWNKFK